MTLDKPQITLTDDGPWDFHTGNLALDFANTIDWPESDKPREMLNGFTDLISWAAYHSVLSRDELQTLANEADRKPDAAAKAVEDAVALRDAIYAIFTTVAHNSHPKTEDLNKLKEMWGQAVASAEIIPQEKGYSWSWQHKKTNLEYLLYRVSNAAIELLLTKTLSQVGQCADDRGCGLLFIDTSRNHSRQWCSMENCGNRAKAQRFYQRKKVKA